MEDVCRDVICVTTFSSSGLGYYIKKIKTKYNVHEWFLSVSLVLDKRNKTCLMDFENVNDFLKLWKKIPSMKNNLSY